MRTTSIGWSALGLTVPLLVALVLLPSLLHRLGPERFGLLSLAWALTAMSGLFDLGIGRAATQSAAAHLGRGRTELLRPTLHLAVRQALVAGCCGALLCTAAVAAGLHRGLRYSPALESEVAAAALLLALLVPLQASMAAYRGLSEACGHFKGISLVRIGLGVAHFAVPWLLSMVTTSLPALVAALVVSRGVGWMAYRALALRHAPPGHGRLDATQARALRHAGGWFSISAVVSPLLVQADRFFIAALLSATAVTTYAIPFDLVTQLLVGVTAVTAVAFPAISSAIQRDPAAARALFRHWLLRVALGMALLCAAVAAVLPAAMAWWLGTALPEGSVSVGRWLCLGVWINAVGSMYFAWLHAHGRYRDTAILHLLELPLYAGALVLLLQNVGIAGAAIAWVGRVTLDTAVLAWWGRSRTPDAP